MKLTHNARHQLLDSIRLLTQSVYAQFHDETYQYHTRFFVGDIDDAKSSFTASQNEQFVSEIEHSFEDNQFRFSFEQNHFLHIHFHPKQLPFYGESEQRKNDVVQLTQEASVTLQLACNNEFPEWLMALTNTTKINEYTTNQVVFFRQFLALIQSCKVFGQYKILTEDSLTRLQSRAALQGFIDEGNQTENLHLCMIHCRDFQSVNKKFGQAQGDRILTEIADILSTHTRKEDLACRFGGALFGIAFAHPKEKSAEILAEKLQTQLHKRHYLGDATRLSFNVGVASISLHEAKEENVKPSALLLQRAEQSLRAAQSSDKPSIVTWQAGKFAEDEQEFNYLGGIFTPDNITNYRNMLLLWDISSIIADEFEFTRLVTQVIQRLACTFEFTSAGILSEQESSKVQQHLSISQMAEVSAVPRPELLSLKTLQDLSAQAIANQDNIEQEDEQFRYLILPLTSDTKACLYLVGERQSFNLTYDSTMLFAGFARQMGKALKRSQLEEALNQKLEKQNAKLAEELNTLKTGLKSSALVYRSEVMQKVMHQTQRAAQTDTTVLITGESGTGKEKLINAVHLLGDRAKKPLVIVDCGSIPETLIESELFGYVKGAFTGAQGQSIGKIQAANHGVLVLDEIGELPISMQPKLLRFVQEKSYTPIGGNTPIQVNVKIIAVTNRDLAQEVRLGKFRQDLYFRLNVLHLHSPPLRKRLDDLELLCRHFLNKFAHQYEMPQKTLEANAIELMRQYSWPGNVRELENKLMQATLLCHGDIITFSDLSLDENAVMQQAELPEDNQASIHLITSDKCIAKGDQEATDTQKVATFHHEHTEQAFELQNVWQSKLELTFTELVRDLFRSPHQTSFELGTWAEHTIFMLAMNECRTNKAIAHLLQIPISTARRRAQKAQAMNKKNIPANWSSLMPLFLAVVQGNVRVNQPLKTIRTSLLKAVLSQKPANMTQAAQILGVSEPTFYKLKRELN